MTFQFKVKLTDQCIFWIAAPVTNTSKSSDDVDSKPPSEQQQPSVSSIMACVLLSNIYNNMYLIHFLKSCRPHFNQYQTQCYTSNHSFVFTWPY